MPRPSRLLRTVLAILLGAGLALALTAVVVLVFVRRETLEPLTPENLAAARARWHAHGPANYDLDLSITGRRSGTVKVEVRNHEVTRLVRDGVEPKQRRTWSAWSIPGQLDTLATELAAVKNPEQGFGAPPGARVIERVRFDPQLGYPVHYERYVLGTDLDMGWRVTRFAPR